MEFSDLLPVNLTPRVTRFLEDVVDFKQNEAVNHNVKDVMVDETSLTFSLSVNDKIKMCSIIASEADYPGGTVIFVDEIALDFTDGSIAQAFQAILKGVGACGGFIDSGHASGDEVDVLNESTDHEDLHMESDDLAQHEFAEAREQLGSVFAEHHSHGLGHADIYLKIKYSNILPEITMKAWGLPLNNEILLTLDDVYLVDYRFGIKLPQLKVELRKRKADGKVPGILQQIRMIGDNYIIKHYKIDEIYLRDKAYPKPNFIVSFYDYMRARLCHLSEHCLICDEKLVQSRLMMPSVCFKPLCIFAHTDLGIMADVGALAIAPEVIDLLLAMLCQAIARPHQLNPFPSIPNPDTPTQLILDPDSPNFGLLNEIVSAFPAGESLFEILGNLDALKQLHVLAWPLIRWTMTSNRAYIVPIPAELQLDFMNTPHQFLMITDSPVKETAFRAAKAASPQNVHFVFHGSPAFNWHSIVRRGLIVASNTSKQLHGNAYGKGIYYSPLSEISANYSYCSTGHLNRSAYVVNVPGNAPTAHLVDSTNMTCIAICEIVGDQVLKHSNGQIWTLDNPDHCCTRFLFAYSQGGLQPNLDLRNPEYVTKLNAALQHYNLP